MPLSRSSIFLEVVEGLSKNKNLIEGDEIEMSKELLFKATHFLKTSRANIWLIDEENNQLSCLMAYDSSKDVFYQEEELHAENFPIYFSHLGKNEIIVSHDTQNEPYTTEIIKSYLIPHNISSMMEVPIISGGKLKGVFCFEHTGELRQFTNDEQHFAIALTQFLTLTLETKEKNIYRDDLEKLVNEKSTLINEINHRVKNNLAVITALIRAESNKVKDEFHKDLFDNILSKAFSLSSLQDSMFQSKNYKSVNFSEFTNNLVGNLNDTYGFNLNVNLKLDLGDNDVDISKAIPSSLILNEIITNAYKYAFSKEKSNLLEIKLNKIEPTDKKDTIKYQISISDNGPGLPDDYLIKGSGYELIIGLVDQIDGDLFVESSNDGTTIILTF